MDKSSPMTGVVTVVTQKSRDRRLVFTLIKINLILLSEA